MSTTSIRATQFTTSADGTELAYEVTGSGPALVLVDGALCHRAMGPARGLAKELSGSFTVYAYDRRGRGESGAGASPYAIQREVEDLAAVIDVAGGSAHVCGVSSGGAGAGGGEGRRRDGAARGVRGAVHRRWHTSGQRPPPARAGAGDGRGGPTRGGGQDVHADRRRAGTGHRAHAADARVEAAIAVAHTLPRDLSIVIEHEQGKPLPVGYYEESSRRPW